MVVVKCTSAPAVTLTLNNTCLLNADEKPYEPAIPPAAPAPPPAPAPPVLAAFGYGPWPVSESEKSNVEALFVGNCGATDGCAVGGAVRARDAAPPVG
jgi:hypothetical protein